MKGKKALWLFVGLLFVAGIVVAAVLGTRGGERVETTALPDGPSATAVAVAPPDAAVAAAAAVDAAAAAVIDGGGAFTVGGGSVPDAAPVAVADAAAAVDAVAAVVDATLAEAVPDAAAAAKVAVDAAVASGGGAARIEFDEPRVVGDVDPQPILDALAKLEPQLESCRPKGKEVAKVKVQFHVGLGGLRLAAPAADNTGDASVARCIANRVKSSKPAWKEDESGIIIVDASVPPRP